MTVADWRKKHRRCEFCKHLNFFTDGFFCIAKSKEVHPTLPRPFCRLFQLEGMNNDN